MSFKIKNLCIHPINEKDISEKWINWLNDEIVNKYGDKGDLKHTKKSQKKWFNIKKRENVTILGIYVNNEHVGVCEIGNISIKHKNCEISYMLGEKKLWGKGYGSILIDLMCKYAKKNFKVKKIVAHTFENNLASQKVLRNNGFSLEGKIKNFYKFKKRRVAKKIFGKNV